MTLTNCAALTMAALGLWSGSLSYAQSTAAIDSKADELLQSMSRALAAPQTIRAYAFAKVRFETTGMLQEYTSTYTIALARPNKLFVRGEGPYLGSTVITDGTTLTRYNLQRKTYKSDSAPAELQPVFESSAGGITGIGRDPLAFIGDLLGKTPYEALMKGVTGLRHLGQETVAGIPTDHLQFTADDVKWDMWLRQGEAPLPVKVSIDLTTSMLAGMANTDNRRYFGDISFWGWELNPQVPPDTFAFVPPSDAKPEKAIAPHVEPAFKLLGKPAPQFKLPLLTGGEVDFAALKGKVVVLDFWATWCGPCRQALPIVSSTSLELKPSGVEFFAVDVKEEAEDVRDYLKQAKLEIPVAMDKDGDVSNSFKVEGIPQTVLIGKDGTVQVVHVGFGPTMGPQLKKEIEDLVAGKTLATSETIARLTSGEKTEAQADEEKPDEKATPAVKKDKAAPDALTSRGVQLAWKREGAWTAVTADSKSGAVFAANLKGEGIQLASDGKPAADFKLPASVSSLKLMQHNGKPALLGYQSWGRSLIFMDASGAEVWTALIPEGISEVTAADLDGDNVEEVVIAANGDPAVQVLKNDGSKSWESEKLAKAARIDNAKLSTDGSIHVWATGTDGKLHDFSSTGSYVRRFDPKVYATIARLTQSSPTLVLAAGTTKGGEGIAAVELDGKAKWTTPLSTSARASIDAVELSPDESMVAVALRGGAIHIVDVSNGDVLGTVAAQGLRPEIAWLGGNDRDQLLLIATGSELNAVRITKTK